MKRASLRMLACISLLVWIASLPGAESPNDATKPAARVRSAAAMVVPPKLIGALKSKTDEQRLQALHLLSPSLVQQPAVANALRETIARDLRQKRVTLGTQLALRSLSYSGRDDDIEYLRERLKESDATVALTAAEALSEQRDVAAMPGVADLAKRKEYSTSYGFRRTVVDAAARIPDKSAIEFLISVARQSNGQLRFETVQHLSRLTGQNFGGFADQWAEWWQTNGERFQATATDDAPAASALPRSLGAPVARIPWPEEVPEFFDVPVYGYRVVFVIDHSRSMASSVDGITRLKEAQSQLNKAVDALSPYAYFNVLSYNSDVQAFARGLVQADEANKRGVHRFCDRLSPAGKTACYDALYAGLMTDENLESMYFLSDGEPNVGRIVEMPAIVSAITTQNVTQRTTIYTLGIDSRGEHEEFLRQLADRNFGQFFQIR